MLHAEDSKTSHHLRVDNLWDETKAKQAGDELDLLVYRSNLLGLDRRVCNWKGGNTSTKCTVPDIHARPRRVMFVKGSGSDLATIDRSGFAGLWLDDVEPLIEREHMTDEEMVDALLQCMMHPNMPRQSIETLLHAFIPFDYVDHTHPDSIIAFCTTDIGEQLAKEAFGDTIAWIPYIRPGFDLAKQIGLAVRNNPHIKAVFMAKHGLVTWGNTAEQCYNSTIEIINQAAAFIEERMAGKEAFGGAKVPALSEERRQAEAIAVLPVIRGAVSRNRRMILHYDYSPDTLEFVNSRQGKELALTGAACPDHLVHTKYVPLYVDYNPAEDDLDTLKNRIREGVDRYAEEYKAYVDSCRADGDAPMGDPYPRIILIPGIGLIATGPDKATAMNAAGLFERAIEVMRGASALGNYISMTPKEAYDVEYWPLELYKLTLAPPEKELARRVALITGGAGGIGKATAELMAKLGAHVVVADIAAERAQAVAHELEGNFGAGRALAAAVDVTDEQRVVDSYSEAILHYGGVDIVVSNAGVAMSKPIEETSLAEWDRLFAILSTGYFLVSKEAARLMKEQGIGGSIIFVTSKNAMVASSGAAAYNAAKASELHLARSLAQELGKDGIRVNCVAPDAVLEGSLIWSGKWREERAAAYGIRPDELEEYYRKRTVLQVNVYPSDIAEAVLFFASDRSGKTTGCTLTVDGGVQAAYMR